MTRSDRLELEIDGRPVTAELTIDGEVATIRIGDQTATVAVSRPEPGLLVLLHENRVFRSHQESSATGESIFNINDRRVRVEVRDRRRRRPHPVESGGPASLASPMPGKVVNLLVSEGAMVEPGQGLIIVEAMKMQNEIQAPRAGRVATIRATIGQTVNAGEVLVVVE
jgi:biotin carboxyl carrier protein